MRWIGFVFRREEPVFKQRYRTGAGVNVMVDATVFVLPFNVPLKLVKPYGNRRITGSSSSVMKLQARNLPDRIFCGTDAEVSNLRHTVQ
jgi:hypothetical protein